MRISLALALFMLALLAGCNRNLCIRHSDCPGPLICSEYGSCELPPVDDGGGDGATDGDVDLSGADLGADSDQAMPDLGTADLNASDDLAEPDLAPSVDDGGAVIVVPPPVDLGRGDLPRITGSIGFTLRPPVWRIHDDAGID